MDTDSISANEQLTLARALVEHLEAGDKEQASKAIRELRQPYERELFDELGMLTRDLHEALNGFRGDSRLLELTEEEIPDAKERLNYVVTMTEQATNRTLNAVDETLPVVERLQASSSQLVDRWEQFRRRKLSLDEFRELVGDLDAFLASSHADSEDIKSALSEIMMAQDFQDLTGQIIGRVVRLVQEAEEKLVGLIRLSSGRMDVAPAPKESEDSKTSGIEGTGPVVPNTKDSGADTVAGQDDVDALLSSLGF